MAALQKIWTSSADFDTGTYTNANAATPGEVRKISNSTGAGIWQAEFDGGLGSHPLWQALTLAFDVQGSSSVIDVYARSSASSGDVGGTYQYLGQLVTGMGSSKVFGLSSAYGRRRYFQVMVILSPIPTTSPANARLLSVQLDGQTTTPGASVDPDPIAGAPGQSGAKAAWANAAGARAAWA